MRVEVHDYKGEQNELDHIADFDDQNGMRNNNSGCPGFRNFYGGGVGWRG